MTNEELYKTLEKLDSERTQGEWEVLGEDVVDSPDRNHIHASICKITKIADYKANQQFIAQAPAMMAYIRELRAENEGLKQGGWQPIETAPKDKWIFVLCEWTSPTKIALGKNRAKLTKRTKSGWQIRWLDGSSCYTLGVPTYWQPLPTPPKQLNEEE